MLTHYYAFSDYDFGYRWPWTHGHLIPVVFFGALAVLAWRWRWPRWTCAISGILAVWGLVGFFIVQSTLQINQPLRLPTDRFLSSGSGRVLDMGAGSGRSALMVLLARPDSRVVALDLFEDGSGINDNTPQRLRTNARVAYPLLAHLGNIAQRAGRTLSFRWKDREFSGR